MKPSTDRIKELEDILYALEAHHYWPGYAVSWGLKDTSLSEGANDEMEPCPFCGEKPYTENTATEYIVGCRPCGIMMSRDFGNMSQELMRIAAADNWNARVKP